jgi:hypothetical protein
MTVEQTIVTRLLAVTAITALVGDRVSPVVLRTETTDPALVYVRLYGDRQYALDGATKLATVQMQIMAWALDYATARALADQVRLGLDTWGDADVEIVTVTDGADTYAEEIDMYGCPVNLTVKYEEV